MPEDVIHFSCGSCHTKLTVPSKLAGVEGPCPKCGATIRAPRAEPAPTPAPAPVQPAPPGPAAVSAPGRRPEALPERRGPATAATPPSEQERIRPEPRELPERPARAAVSPRHSTADVSRRPEPQAERASGSSGKGSGLQRFLIPVLFLFLGGALAYVLLHSFLGTRNLPPTGADAPAPAYPGPNPAPAGDPATTAASPGGNSGAATPLAPDDLDPADGQEAEDVLRDFLRASSIGARLPLIEPEYERGELVGSVIDTPLLSADRITPDAPNRNSDENFVDHPFRVRFEQTDAEPFTSLVIVRKRAGQKARVLIDPVLDLLGGRLAAFAAEPSDEPQTFRAVIEAMPRCFEEGVPNPDNKITYKLSSSTHGGEIARAYASKMSPLAEMLYSPDSALRWGKRVPATVTLRWNREEVPATAKNPAPPEEPSSEEEPPEEGTAPTEEEPVAGGEPAAEATPTPEAEPGQPYLELIEIKSLDWSP